MPGSVDSNTRPLRTAVMTEFPSKGVARYAFSISWRKQA
jgi:hypothetical protein